MAITTRAMAESQKRTTRSMTAKRKPKRTELDGESSPTQRKATRKAKSAAKKPRSKAPLIPNRHISIQHPRSRRTNHNAQTSRQNRAPQYNASPDANRTDDAATSTGSTEEEAQASDADSRESWEKEITNWRPGERPPLKHHPYDMFMNRPSAKYGKMGRRPPSPKPQHDSSDEESDHTQAEEPPQKSGPRRLRGGWIEEQSDDDSENLKRDSSTEDTEILSGNAESWFSSDSSGIFRNTETFISSRGNEYFCEIDEDYLTDRFNLTGLNTDVQYYQYALDLVTDVFDLDCDDDMREQIEKSARHLYGLVHARYITTTRGLSKMLEKYKRLDFGKCPRVACASHPLLPTGLSDLPHIQSVKLYCGKCEDLYNPKSSRHATIDGAYFGTSFQNILFQVYPALAGEKSIARYEPRIFGFRVHAAAALERWQARKREEMVESLKGAGITNIFVEEVEEVDVEEMEEGEDGMGE